MTPVELLKKYNLYLSFQAKCENQGLNKAINYDMKSINDVIIELLTDQIRDIESKKSDLLLIECINLDRLSNRYNTNNNICNIVSINGSRTYCKENCSHYKNNITAFDLEIAELDQAIKDLSKASKKDQDSI